MMKDWTHKSTVEPKSEPSPAVEIPQGITVYRARVSTWRTDITTMVVDRVSELSVWINNRKLPRVMNDQQIFDDFSSAKSWLVHQYQRKITHAQREIEKSEDKIRMISAIEPDDVKFDNQRY